jgi:hypothetical protein
VRRCECEMLLPKPGPLPHTSQTEATVRSNDRLAESRLVPDPLCLASGTEGSGCGSLSSLPDRRARREPLAGGRALGTRPLMLARDTLP